MKDVLEISTLGGVSILHSGKPVMGLASRKADALLVYLACNRRTHSREVLATLFWEEHSQNKAMTNLRVVLSSIRKQLEPFIKIEPDTVAVNPESHVWLDIAVLEDQLSPVQEQREPISPRVAKQIERALALYQGNFLEGFYVRGSPAFEDWASTERQRLHYLVEDVLSKLLTWYLERGEYSAGISHAIRLLQLSPLMEEAHQHMMRLLAYSGRRGAALKQYETYRHNLEENLGVEPSGDTTTLYKQILFDNLEAPRVDFERVSDVLPPAFLDDESEQLKRPQSVFLGRGHQLSQLDRFLEKALEGRGQVVFVSAEAGGGKTALMAKFARRAQKICPELIVAMGACKDYTGFGDPYLPFREVLSMLTGEVETLWAAGHITTAHARRLWHLLPDAIQVLVEQGPDLIDSFISGTNLVSRDTAYGPDKTGRRERLKELVAHKATLAGSPEIHQNRIYEEYTAMLSELAKKYPLLLILDDLHWADISSIGLLFHLGRQIRESRILIVGAYRPDDVMQRRGDDQYLLFSMLSEFKRQHGEITIDLDQGLIEESLEFTEAFLDIEPNRLGKEFRQEFYQTTRGHPLFTIELLRDMQERGDIVQDETGFWVEAPSLAWDIIPARIEGVVEKRIGRLDGELREALVVASVEGEVFTAEVLSLVLGGNGRRLIRRLSEELGRQHRLVTVSDPQKLNSKRLSRYRFRHSLFQKYIYYNLSNAERIYLHEEVGRALEKLYGEHAEEISVQLAWHFQEGGIPTKATPYLYQAGKKALEVSANEEAIVHLTRALTLITALSPGPKSEEIKTVWQIPPRLVRVRLERQLGRAYYRLGELNKSREHLEQAVAIAGIPLPRTRARLVVDLVIQIQLQILRRLFPHRMANKASPDNPLLREASYIYKLLDEIYLFANDLIPTLYAAIRALNLAERVGPTPELARAYGDVASATQLMRLPLLSDKYRHLAFETAQLINQPSVTGYVYLATSVYVVGEGRWSESNDNLSRANELHKQMGNWNRLGIGLVLLANNYYYQGEYVRSKDLYFDVLSLGQRSGSVQHQIWGLDGQAENLLRLGRTNHELEVIALLEKSAGLIADNPDKAEELRQLGLLSVARLRLGQSDAAQEAAEAAALLISHSPPSLLSTLEGYSGVAETYLTLWETSVSPAQRNTLARLSRQACTDFRRFAMVFLIGRPRSMLWHGLYSWIAGKPTQAQIKWHKSLAIARKMGMPFEEGLAHYEIGRHMAGNDPSGRKHLHHARDIFAQLGAKYDLDRSLAIIG